MDEGGPSTVDGWTYGRSGGLVITSNPHLEFSLWLYFHEQGLTEWLICSPMITKTHLTDKQTCLNAFSLLNNSIWVKKPFLWFFSYQKLNWSWIRGWCSITAFKSVVPTRYFSSVIHGPEPIGPKDGHSLVRQNTSRLSGPCILDS